MAAGVGAALVGVAGNLLGGLFGRKSQKSAAQKQRNWQVQDYYRDRRDYISDKQADRRYSEYRTIDDRKYAARRTHDDRLYVARQTQDQRNYDARQTADERRYAASLVLDQRQREDALYAKQYEHAIDARDNDRAYAARRLADDRAYMDTKRDEDIAQFKADRNQMQYRSDTLAEKTAASRGVDVMRLRDDFVKAGYNPMTALNFAHMYSTQTDYSLQGGVYSPGANYTASGPGYNASSPSLPSAVSGGTAGAGGGSGGGAAALAPSQTAASHIPAGGSFQAPGGGYPSTYDPNSNISSGKFIADAFELAGELAFNKVQPKDELAEALRDAMGTKLVRDAEIEANPVGRKFGYALTDVQPFQPAMTVGVPALRKDQSVGFQPADRPLRKPYDREERIPVKLPMGTYGSIPKSIAKRMDIEPWSMVSAEEYTSLTGELVGEGEVAANYNSVRQNSVGIGTGFLGQGSVPLSPSITDYMGSGTTGSSRIDSLYNRGYGY